MERVYIHGSNKKYLCLLLITILAFVPTTIIKATDESSYQYGYKQGRKGYSCSKFNASCDNGLSSCDAGHHIWNNSKVVDTVTNKTACLNGYVDGWKQWCNTDLSLCAKFFISNVFPGALADNESSVDICLKNASDDVPNNDSSNILSPLSKHCDGSIGETTSPAWKVFEDMSTNWRVIHTNKQNMTKQDNAALQKQNSINGTWNFVNETRGPHDNYTNSRLAGSGTITFHDGRFIQRALNTYQIGSYSVDWLSQILNLDYFKDGSPWFNVDLVFKTISPNFIRLVDSHDDTINLIRANTTISTNQNGTEDFNEYG